MANLHTTVFLVLAAYCGYSYGCVDSWVGHNGMCYLFSHDTEAWIGALQVCRELRAQLAEVESAEENLYLQAQIQIHAKDQWWIALSDINEENVWVWMNSKKTLNSTGYSDWFPGQPDNHGMDQNCGAYYINKNHQAPSWQWNDVACRTANHYICEKADSSGEIIG